MELIERPNLTAVKFLNSISYETFKQDCIGDAEKNVDKKPTDKDIKTWYNVLKQFCKTNLKTKGITKRIYSYSQTTPAGLGGRLFSGGSLQGIWSVYRGLCMRDVGTDIDMSNCHPVLLRYICQKHSIHCPNLDYYIQNRAKCLSEFQTKAQGKTAYLVATNNDKRSRWNAAPTSFKQYDREMKVIQQKLVELPDYKNLQETIPEYKLSKNYNGSVINRILCFYENTVLQHAIHIINSKGIEIAILMFDGLMVYGDYYADEGLLRDIETFVEEQMVGLNMKWAYKEHDDTLEVPDDFDESDDGLKDVTFSNDNDCGNYIYKLLKEDIICCNNQIFIKVNNVWFNKSDYLVTYLTNFIMEQNIYKRISEDKKVLYWKDTVKAGNVVKAVLNKIKLHPNDDLYNLFHSTTKGRLCILKLRNSIVGTTWISLITQPSKFPLSMPPISTTPI